MGRHARGDGRRADSEKSTMLSWPVGSTTLTVAGKPPSSSTTSSGLTPSLICGVSRAVRRATWPSGSGTASGPIRGLGSRARPAELGIEQGHRRRADEVGDEHVGRPVVDLRRRGELLQEAAAHDGDPRRHGHRLELVVRDVDHRLADRAVQLDQLGAHVGAQLGVEVGQRLVEQEDAAARAPARGRARRAAAGRPTAGAACASRSGSSCSSARDRRDPRRPLGLRHAALPQRIGDVLGDRHVRIERVGLEHHGDVALAPAPRR